MKIRVLELFGGVGACTKALKRLGIDVEIVDYVEIDKYAVSSYNAINDTNFEPQDITKYFTHTDIKHWFGDVDLIMHGSPCQDFSTAGKQAGGDENSGTRSSLMYETLRIVERLRPKYIVWENVKNLLSDAHKHNFEKYIQFLNNLGYHSFYSVLNAKDYGIPQNRERVFTVSIRKDVEHNFIFPPKQELKIRLRDLLEDVVEERYYLNDKNLKHYQREFGSRGKKLDLNKLAPTLTAAMGSGGGNVPYFEECKCVRIGGIFDTPLKSHQAGSIWDINGLAPTLDTMQGGWRQPSIMPNSEKIRKLTPRECWRLMGFDDSDFDRASKVCSVSQLYKQAGNSIVVNVLEEIFRVLLLGETKGLVQNKLFRLR